MLKPSNQPGRELSLKYSYWDRSIHWVFFYPYKIDQVPSLVAIQVAAGQVQSPFGMEANQVGGKVAGQPVKLLVL